MIQGFLGSDKRPFLFHFHAVFAPYLFPKVYVFVIFPGITVFVSDLAKKKKAASLNFAHIC
jgi:hypothetical protein